MEKLLILSKKLNVSLDSLMGGEVPGNTPAQNTAKGVIRIVSPHEGVIINASRVMRSQEFKGGAKSPKYALYASDGNEMSYWGAHNTFLGWYRNLEDVTNEISDLQKALDNGTESYTLQYSVKCRQNLFRTIED